MENPNYKAKKAALDAALAHAEGPHMPSVITASVPTVAWVGKTARECILNPEEFVDALTAIFGEMWVDGNVFCASMFTQRQEEYFDPIQNKWGPDGTTPEHIQLPMMRADEYDQLIEDPDKLVNEVLVPRKYPWIYEDRERAKEAIKVYAEDKYYCHVTLSGMIAKALTERYGVENIVSAGVMSSNPADVLFDSFRGFKGSLIDLRRQPEKVKAALDKIWETRCRPMVESKLPWTYPYGFQTPHIAPYLSPKQFDIYYWPYEEKILNRFASQGGKTYVMMEGAWAPVWDHFNDVGKDCAILHIDEDDVFKAKKEIGDNQILLGGPSLAQVKIADMESIKDTAKKIIDVCGVGGGWIFATEKSWISPGDITQNLVDLYNFVHEYSAK